LIGRTTRKASVSPRDDNILSENLTTYLALAANSGAASLRGIRRRR
jgi:hypothetical protein